MKNKKILFIISNYGVETSELLEPWDFLTKKGYDLTLAAPALTKVTSLKLDRDPIDLDIKPSVVLKDVNPDQYHALIIPGGTINADSLRADNEAVRIVKSFLAANKLVAAICHGPWLLVESGMIAGHDLTSYPNLKTDINNAKAKWLDVTESAVVSRKDGKRIITAQSPNQLSAFNKLIEQLLNEDNV